MAAFQNTREHTETKVMVHLLSEIDRNPSFTQRGLAQDLGIALGLMNQYLKSCTAKGWIRASQISPRRISYFLTPEGFKEKSVKRFFLGAFFCWRTCRLSGPMLVSYRKCVLYQENLFSISECVLCSRTPSDFPVPCWFPTENVFSI